MDCFYFTTFLTKFDVCFLPLHCSSKKVKIIFFFFFWKIGKIVKFNVIFHLFKNKKHNICSWGVTHTVFVTFQAVIHFMKVFICYNTIYNNDFCSLDAFIYHDKS